MSLTLTILGCGSSGGTPRTGGDWGACDRSNPKNSRLRCSALLRREGPNGTTLVLIDTSPDCRQQLLSQKIKRLDGVLYTHDHADHTHGIDDLRFIAYADKKRLDVFMDERTGSLLRKRFDYCFETPDGSPYPPILTACNMVADVPVTIDGPGGAITATPFLMEHGNIDALGFRIGELAYCSDLNDFPGASLRHLEGLDTLVINCLRYIPHPSHLTLEQAVGWVERLAPRRGVLTHMHVDLDYDTVAAETPARVTPAHDGMVIDVVEA